MTDVTDPEIIADIERELREGTPDTPERIAAMRRADAAYRTSFLWADQLVHGAPLVALTLRETP